MTTLDTILDAIDRRLSAKNGAREAVLADSRRVVQGASKAIRAIHRHEWDAAARLLAENGTLLREMNARTEGVPDIYFAGYVQDAHKEHAEANLTLALVRGDALPAPEALGVEDAAYLNGLAEAASELRRHTLDLVRHGHLDEGDTLLGRMEEVYDRLIAIDYPHAITDNLRRTTDALRAVLERTRGDVTMAMTQRHLSDSLAQFERRIGSDKGNP